MIFRPSFGRFSRKLRAAGFGGFLWAWAACAAELPAPASHPVDFAREIQPIFAEHCFKCHGEDKQEAQFRLDLKESALQGGELGVAIVPGKSADSLLVQAIAGTKPDLKMPRKGAPLSAEQVGLIRAWIDQGAIWPADAVVAKKDKRDHWAFKPPVRPEVPKVSGADKWAKNSIDYFILARLRKEGLSPSPEADRRTLIRRLSLDLVGLPPTIDEVEEFVVDQRPDAYEQLVERLLASPHYGERWGRHWLDLARYADTNGYEKDKPRSIWPYRDWVIKALNSDMPYDEFTIEQLAGDLLPHATLDQKIATGFLRNSMLNQEGGIEPEQFRVEALVDRMDTIGKTFLGLTINCCQCHNHKFDPFTQKDYYRLYAFLNDDEEAFVDVPSPKDLRQEKEIREKEENLEQKAMAATTNLESEMAAWESSLKQGTSNWHILDPAEWNNFATKFEKLENHSLLGGGDLQAGGVMHVGVDTDLENITAFRLEALTNANLAHLGPGILGKGSFIVKEFVVEAWALKNPTVTNRVKFTRAVADMEAPGFSIASSIDGNTDKGGWTPTTTFNHRNENHVAMFECAEPVGFPGGTHLSITLYQKMDSETKLDCHMLGNFRLSATTDPLPAKLAPVTPATLELLAVPSLSRSPAQKLALFDLYRFSGTNFSKLNEEISEAFSKWPTPPTTMVLQDRTPHRVTHLFKRGDRLRPGDVVEADVPDFLNPWPEGAPRNRLGLARWMTDPRSPTTARAMVNRMWQIYFGQGLVTTPEDFGTRVETPSHPQLLDWLACELMQPQESTVQKITGKTSGPKTRKVRSTGSTLAGGAKPIALATVENKTPNWSLKHMHRLIVTSATYRQASIVPPELLEKDAYNRWLARGPRFRVEGEIVQDIALSVGGLLNNRIGGASVYPSIPASVGDTSYGGFSWPESKEAADRYRRGMYTFAKRSLPFPSLIVFDGLSGEVSCPRRVRSNTPLQALTTLNEKTFVEASKALGMRLYQHQSDDADRLRFGFELCTSRVPTAFEAEKLLAFWREQYEFFENHTAAAVTVALADPKDLPAEANLHKVAAWVMVGRAMLNLDETFTRE